MTTPTIKWIKPDLEDELGEYFENDHTRNFLAARGIVFDSPPDLLTVLERGRLIYIDEDDISRQSGAWNVSNPREFEVELSDKAYARSFDRMQSKLDRGDVTLPAPILLKFGHRYYGFAGNRRTNLAFLNDVPLKCWVVDMSKDTQNESLIRQYVREVISPAYRGSLRHSTENNTDRNDLSGNFQGLRPTADEPFDDEPIDDDQRTVVVHHPA